MILQDFGKFSGFSRKIADFSRKSLIFWKILQILEKSARQFCRFWKMLQNAYLDAEIGVDTAENEPRKES